MEATNQNPSIYVGTYGKYNNGDLSGAWLDLTKYSSFDELLADCKNLHKDERDPEYMVQDYENMPDGLSMDESLNRQDFDDIKTALSEQLEETDVAPTYQIIDYSEKAIALVGDTKAIKEQLKQLGGRFNPKLSCGAGWIFSKKKEDELRAMLYSDVAVNAENKISEQPSKETEYKSCLSEYCKLVNDSGYKGKGNIGAVKIGELYYLIPKPSIENRFCFHDEGPDYDFYCSLMEDKKKLEEYFIEMNLKSFDSDIEKLKKHGEIRPYNKREVHVCSDHYQWEHIDGIITLAEEQKTQLIEAIEYGRSCMEKRLMSYLKRWGTSKIHTWTYWADR